MDNSRIKNPRRTRKTSLATIVVGVALLAAGMPASAVPILLDLHAGGHGAAVTDGTAWFQDNHKKHNHKLNFLTLKKDEPDDDGTLAGHNGSAAGTEYPNVFTNPHTPRDILLSEVPLFFGYRVFLFDGNQEQKAGVYDHLDMTMLMLYTAASPQGTLPNIQANGMLAYDLDGTLDHTVRIEGRVGNAGADMHLFVPDSLFHRYGNGPEDTYVYLFSKFLGNTAGREHWNLGTGEFNYTNPVPIPATWLLLAGGLCLLGRQRARGGRRLPAAS